MKKKPNIIFMMSDDQGIWSLGCYGNEEIQTPNLDQLAATGVKFTNFFCTSPVCSPSRASLLTGKVPSQHGVHDWIAGGNVEGPIEYLQDQLTYTDILAKHNYECGISGKWHLGDSLNKQKGFSHWYVHQAGGGPYYGAPMVQGGKCINEDGYVTEAITNDALGFLEKQRGNENPFYLSIHYTAPHDPWLNSHPEEFVSLYEDCPFETCPQNEPQPWFTRTMHIGDNWREQAKGYYAAITAMDQQIGRVLNYLDEHDLRKDTLIIFTSDNGFSCGHHGFWGKGNGTTPLNMYDYSVKVPFMMSHQGQLPAGEICDALVSGYDFMPTLIDYVGIDTYEHDHTFPGQSFVPLLKGNMVAEEGEPVIIYDEYGPVRMIRTKEWKYIYRLAEDEPDELYDLVNDPREKVNIITDPAVSETLIELRRKLFAWFQAYVDPTIDGLDKPVKGLGQIGRAGMKGKGPASYL